MTHTVFISYSHNDKPIADAICANLEGAGVHCWIAPRDIAPGLDWPTAISDAIVASRIMVLVFSASANSSHDVSRELFLAANNNLIIIPFKIDNITPEPGKQYYLARTHWLDAMNPPTQEQINRLLGFVKSFMTADMERREKPQPAAGKEIPPPPPPPPSTEPKPLKLGDARHRRMLWVWGFLITLALVTGGIWIGKNLQLRSNGAMPVSTPTFNQAATTPSPSATTIPSPSATASPTAESVVYTVDILAKTPYWSETGIVLNPTNEIKITATGQVDLGGVISYPNGTSDITPMGLGLVKSVPYGSLVGMIGSNVPFLVGEYFEGSSPDSGNLRLLINDIPNGYVDNSGQYHVIITIIK